MHHVPLVVRVPQVEKHWLNLFENSLSMKYLFPLFGMVSGLHIVLSFAWSVILDLIIHLNQRSPGPAREVVQSGPRAVLGMLSIVTISCR